ncbi:MAG: hypothetical protein IPH93_15205 [Saprospiraceae bacterium]|nr:hypothetical protein [Saprospiraceae bacterium]
MNFKVIDTYDTTLKYLEKYHGSLGTFSLITETKIVDILAHIVGDTGGVFISMENSYAGSNRSELKGIELIFWLRLKLNFLGPIITYGFLSTDQILKLNPKHLIIHVPGNFHWRLGDKLDERDIPGPVRMDFIKSEAFKPYLKAAFDLNEFRHEEANWWAMKSLIDVHRAFEPSAKYPDKVIDRLLGLNNLIANFLFSGGTFSFSMEGVESSNLNEADLIKNLENYKRSLQLLKIFPNPKEEKALLKRIEDSEQLLIEIRNQKKSSESQYLKPVIEIKAKEIIGNKKIVVIDDMFYQGWEDTYNTIFGTANFSIVGTTLPHDDIATETELIDNIYTQICCIEDIYAIILDLRLRNEDKRKDVSEYTGIKVLRHFKQNLPNIPIIITTASNKSEAYRLCELYGADAYWMKRGLDTDYGKDNILHDYSLLWHYIFAFESEQYRVKTKLANLYLRIKTSPSAFWWNDYKWDKAFFKDVKRRPVYINGKELHLKEQLIKVLEEILGFYSKFLFYYFVSEEVRDSFKTSIYFTGIAIKIGEALELIHPYQNIYGLFYSVSHIAQLRGDEKANNLYKKRNEFAHNINVPKDFDLLQSFLMEFIDYIDSKELILSEKLIENKENNIKKSNDEITKSVIKEKIQEEKALYNVTTITEPEDLSFIQESIGQTQSLVKAVLYFKK